MNPTLKGVITDFVRAGAVVASILAIVLAAAPSLNVPAQWIAYIAVGAGVVNSILGVLKPYASNLVSAAKVNHSAVKK